MFMLEKYLSKLHPAKLATGCPQPAGLGFPAVMSPGVAECGNCQTWIPLLFHCIA